MRGILEYLKRLTQMNNVRSRAFRRRVPVVRQLAAADCGAAALAMVLQFYGKDVSLEELKTSLGTGRTGTTVSAILRVARRYGLRGRGVRVELEGLVDLPAGSILHWEFRHFVVFERFDGTTADIVDPSLGRRSVPRDRLGREFTGVALLFELTDRFERVDNKTSKHKIGLLKQLFTQRELLIRIITNSILLQILSAAMPVFTGIMIDRVVPYRDYSLLFVLTMGYCALQVFSILAEFVRSHLFIHFRSQLELRFTLGFIDHLLELPYSYFQQHTSGDLMARFGSNSTVRDILTSSLLSTLMDGTMAGIYLVLLAFVNIPLTMIVLFLAVARVILLMFIRWRQKQVLAAALMNQSRAYTIQVEILSGMETLKIMGVEHRAADDWANIVNEGLNISIKRGRLDALFDVVLGLLGSVSTIALMFYGTFLVLQGAFTLGTMMAFSALAGTFLTPLNRLVASGLQLQMLDVYLERIDDVMQTLPEAADGTISCSLSGSVALEHVSFRYGPEERLVVSDVSLAVEPGWRVALVGSTGCGKSTLARLIAGLYDPVEGRILFDGRDLKTLDRRYVRNQLGIVTQDTQLFGGSIRRNIALADPEMHLDRIVQAAKTACLHEEIVAMTMGYETPIADRGLSLSGGQRQRLAIARALANNPKILILDEATSHLDAITEQRLNRNLATLHCTCLVIAHRLSTVRDADLIVVIEGGVIVECGTHTRLQTLEGYYSKLLGSQQDSDVPRVHVA